MLLGIDHPEFGVPTVHVHEGGRTVELLCAGGEGLDAARGAKLESAVPNEDSVLTIEDGPRTLLAVADSHFGYFASHALIERLEGCIGRGGIPRSPLDLLGVLPFLSDERAVDSAPTPPGDESASTLLAVVVDRGARQLFGVSIGDSACFGLWLDAEEVVSQRLDRPTSKFAAPGRSRDLDPRRAREIQASLPAQGMVMVCTDGVHECCYRQPERSIGLRDLAELAAGTGVSPEEYARRLGALALAGVEGQPGGQDNIALAVTAVSDA